MSPSLAKMLYVSKGVIYSPPTIPKELQAKLNALCTKIASQEQQIEDLTRQKQQGTNHNTDIGIEEPSREHNEHINQEYESSSRIPKYSDSLQDQQ